VRNPDLINLMGKKDFIEKEGIITESLPGGKFRIELLEDDREVIGYLSGKMRRFRIWILLGDKVKVEFSEYDNSNCRITYRYKK